MLQTSETPNRQTMSCEKVSINERQNEGEEPINSESEEERQESPRKENEDN